MTIDKEQLKDFIIKILEEKNIHNINVIKLGEEVTIANYMIFGTGRSVKNISSIAEFLAYELKHKQECGCNIEGLRGSDWVIIDTGPVIVHLFNEEAREHIKLEELWDKK
ncbi:MAG: ribosome silencing factor [Rickettsiaceae bacterium]|nr:ribosome silencing factor [Rickettsiaceae bacterium]